MFSCLAQKITSLFKRKKKGFPSDFTEEDIRIIKECLPYTMTNRDRLHAMLQSVRHVVRYKIEGDIVECGVWRGGNILAGIKAAQALNEKRDFWLYDTFAGMSEPDQHDISKAGESAIQTYNQTKNEKGSSWCCASLEDVQNTVSTSQYPQEQVHYVQGMVENTIPQTLPKRIAILRLDTDWYASTKHELEYLYPLLVSGGILIIDDYGFWKGARKAVDEYFAEKQIPIFLHRIDNSARIAVKP